MNENTKYDQSTYDFNSLVTSVLALSHYISSLESGF